MSERVVGGRRLSGNVWQSDVVCLAHCGVGERWWERRRVRAAKQWKPWLSGDTRDWAYWCGSRGDSGGRDRCKEAGWLMAGLARRSM